MNVNMRLTQVKTRTDDPHWYKDAVIYQVHVKSFFDANNDGIGDFAGLIAKLDYIADLGATAIWVLPFYPSPRLDDGYDISDYRGVHSDYGTIGDVRRFIQAAHARGIRVIIELVINHTSDQHPWFQRARHAKPGSTARDFYVWSDTDQKYSGTRIIFIDSERSNWTWDSVAGAFYWHRFYSHQPDLNYDNPRVLRAMLAVMRSWLDLGVDGFRLDAIPYLIEREGTSSENLPETHAILRKIRAELDARFSGKMLLAEANQWPEHAKDYFGSGDECHMAFHFPLMPRMYMAIGREDRFPITDIMRQTPPIPGNCQWAIFLRNHDELTLEMVTDMERDYLWETYAADRRARLNLGIRRRLTPLLERDRRRIELMNFLLLSMPGTPVIYYGDEIGMGDNIHLGDRNGVRTPMQWSPDRNAGFSRADPEKLVLPTIMDPLYGYEAINVEAQRRDPHSLLNWTRRMLAVRGKHRAFGRGALRFLYPKNRKILAYLREDGDATILCVANLAHSPQAVEIDLSEFAEWVPIELNNGSLFPPIGQLTYLLTLPPYGYYWFLLAKEGEWPPWHTPAPEPMPEYQTFVLNNGLVNALTRSHRAQFEREVLPPYLAKRRWFSAKDETILEADVVDLVHVPGAGREIYFCDIAVRTNKDESHWLLPLSIVWEDEPLLALPGQLALARVRENRRVGFLTDAFSVAEFARDALAALAQGARLPLPSAHILFEPMPGGAEALHLPPDAEIEWLTVEQSNSSLIVGDSVMLKMFRRISSGQHPEVEMGRYLTEHGFANSPPLLGEVARVTISGERASLAIAQRFVPNQGDAWSWVTDDLTRALDNLSASENATLTDHIADHEKLAAKIGQTLAEMHGILAQPTGNTAFASIFAGRSEISLWHQRAQHELGAALAIVRHQNWERPEHQADAQILLDSQAELLERVEILAQSGQDALMCRIHGDFHLGQILVAGGEVYIIDFEGQPTTPLEQRRLKDSPLRDVAGLLRSLDYAAGTAVHNKDIGAVAEGEDARLSFIGRFRDATGAAFLSAYRETATVYSETLDEQLLDLFMIEKSAYEIRYEAANRPTWLPIPLAGLAGLARRLLTSGVDHDES
jgi:maltose alpha-D-glucosyltransferase / alpha-amylase